jgi:hypothetical protein
VGTGFAERAPGAYAEGLALVDSERLGRAEACASAADEQDSGQIGARQWLSDLPDCVREGLEVDLSLGLADQVAEQRGVPAVAALVGGDAGEVEESVDRPWGALIRTPCKSAGFVTRPSLCTPRDRPTSGPAPR